jgi:hypothetical protein
MRVEGVRVALEAASSHHIVDDIMYLPFVDEVYME